MQAELRLHPSRLEESEVLGEDYNGDDGYTPLLMAATSGNIEMVEFLLSIGANVGAVNSVDISEIIFQWQFGTNGFSLFFFCELRYELFPLGSWCCSLFSNAYALCLQICLQNGYTALMMAAKHGHLEVVEMLLNAGADVHDRNIQVMFVDQCRFLMIFAEY